MNATASAPKRAALPVRVVRVERLSPSFVRVVLGVEGGAVFRPSGFTDSYVKVVFPDPRGPRPLPLDGEGRLDVGALRATVPADAAPRLRAYTVRSWDADARALTLDVVVHGAAGLGGPWAAGAVVGDRAWVLGPGGFRRSSTARPAWSPSCAATCGSSGGSRVRTSRSRATGASAPTTRVGGPPRRHGRRSWTPPRPDPGCERRFSRPDGGSRVASCAFPLRPILDGSTILAHALPAWLCGRSGWRSRRLSAPRSAEVMPPPRDRRTHAGPR